MSDFRRSSEAVLQEREFAQAVLEVLGEGYEITEVEKTDGIHIGIRVSDVKISPTVYIDKYINMCCDESEAAEMIISDMELYSVPDTSFNVDDVTDWDKVKSQIQVKVINKACVAPDMVAKFLARQGFNDLAEVLFVPVELNGMDGAVTIRQNLFDSYGISKASAFAKAERNTKPNMSLQPMVNVIAKMLGITPEEAAESYGCPNVYVLSNKKNTHGAIHAVLNKDALKEKFSNGYYVIPSSVHECLIVPADGSIPEENLDGMIESVNEEQVAMSERLSDHHYSFVRR